MLSHMDGCVRETPEAQIQHHLALGLALTWLLICGPQAIPLHQLHSYLTDRTSCYMDLTDRTSCYMDLTDRTSCYMGHIGWPTWWIWTGVRTIDTFIGTLIFWLYYEKIFCSYTAVNFCIYWLSNNHNWGDLWAVLHANSWPACSILHVYSDIFTFSNKFNHYTRHQIKFMHIQNTLE